MKVLSKNKIHGKGKFIDKSGTVFEGKFRYGKFIKKINNNTRQVLKLNQNRSRLSF